MLKEKIKFKNTSNKKNDYKWVVTIVVWTFVLSMLINAGSSGIMPSLSLPLALLVLVALVFLGIFFDVIGIAVATAAEIPFHAMAAKKMKGAEEAIRLVRSAEKVSNFCNDVVGDIAGIISGAAATVIVSKLAAGGDSMLLSLIVTAAVAALTVGGKAFGKGLAMRRANAIVYKTALVIHYLPSVRRKKKKHDV